ncbi:glucuronate isomerase [Paenibacillus glycinis]|uniref:Uronate isomerase n=1 Tax=Paenibacillus glycinis TaxID=2697035 RepID=A0ABW9XY14_9BACL|nr:glucuronate isomerase [Paenibacillus glycinis]NBD27411.1 glucuronate isomerase [Paenibacillus glycinis]
MKAFMDERFLLGSETACRLYYDYAAEMPIIDYHCHLDPREIAENRRFGNLTEAWLHGDHYKWRAMRANGVTEPYVTGGEGISDYDRFLAYARTVPQAIGNPLYHWSHLELRRTFGVDDIIHEGNAAAIWNKAQAVFDGKGVTVRDLIQASDVRVICTTDDPADSFEHHAFIRQDPTIDTQVLPSFRPDKALNIRAAAFLPWIGRLEAACGTRVADYAAFLEALKSRIDYFDRMGCRLSDHALDEVPFAPCSEAEASAIFAKAIRGEAVGEQEEQRYKTFTLLQLGRWYAEKNWAMQLHLHAHRNNNGRMLSRLGPDTGYDSIGDGRLAGALVGLLDAWENEGALPRTILYSLNPKDNDVLASIIGSFQGGGIPGKIQFGSAWWFNDTKDGMLAQLSALSNMGLLGRFVGMLTDSRSFLSFTRHEYFRRIVCDMIGKWVERGEAPHDMAWLGGIVQDISFRNAERYFRFGSPAGAESEGLNHVQA